MAIEHLQRIVISNDTQPNVEALVGVLAEIVFGRNTATGAIGYSIDAGATWVWLPIGTGITTLDGLTDVTITSAANGQLLQFNGSAWVNAIVTSPSGELLVTGNSPTAALTNDADTDYLYEG